MRSRKFRNEQFCVGDLVRPNWNSNEPLGLGIILNIRDDFRTNQNIKVFWQLGICTQEAPFDLEVIERRLD